MIAVGCAERYFLYSLVYNHTLEEKSKIKKSAAHTLLSCFWFPLSNTDSTWKLCCGGLTLTYSLGQTYPYFPGLYFQNVGTYITDAIILINQTDRHIWDHSITFLTVAATKIRLINILQETDETSLRQKIVLSREITFVRSDSKNQTNKIIIKAINNFFLIDLKMFVESCSTYYICVTLSVLDNVFFLNLISKLLPCSVTVTNKVADLCIYYFFPSAMYYLQSKPSTRQ